MPFYHSSCFSSFCQICDTYNRYLVTYISLAKGLKIRILPHNQSNKIKQNFVLSTFVNIQLCISTHVKEFDKVQKAKALYHLKNAWLDRRTNATLRTSARVLLKQSLNRACCCVWLYVWLLGFYVCRKCNTDRHEVFPCSVDFLMHHFTYPPFFAHHHQYFTINI